MRALVNTESQNTQMNCQISRRMCNPCGFTMVIISKYHRLLINDVKSGEIDGRGHFKVCYNI